MLPFVARWANDSDKPEPALVGQHLYDSSWPLCAAIDNGQKRPLNNFDVSGHSDLVNYTVNLYSPLCLIFHKSDFKKDARKSLPPQGFRHFSGVRIAYS